MRKCILKKVSSFILIIALVVTYSTGISFADAKITYGNSENKIEKLSHAESGEKMADGILPETGDRANSYSWAMAQLDNYVYLGSNRNILAGTFLQVAGESLDRELTLKFLDDISEGDIPIDDVNDNTARMFRYNTNNNKFEEIYKDPAYTGYRSALTFKAEDAAGPSVYFGSMGPVSRVLRFGQDFKAGDPPEVVYSALPGYASIRAMTEHEGSMCIGVLTIGSVPDSEEENNVRAAAADSAESAVEGNLEILLSTCPAIENWTTIATIEDFAPCNPRTDAGAAAQSGIWDMVSYNGSIYAFVGTGYVKDSPDNGYCVFKGTCLPEDPDANEAGWVWKMIVGPMEDEDGESTGAIYPRGMGNLYDGSASPFLYTDKNGKTYVYVGTFDSMFESIFEILSTRSYESLYRSMHPAKIYRFDENDKWEMVIGNPDEYFDTKIGNYYAGFSSSIQDSIYSPNFYVWRMAQYKDELFAGTFDGTTLLDIIVPPLKIDFENYDVHDLLKILNMFGFSLPDEVIDELAAAVNYADTTSAAAVKAREIYGESVRVTEAGDAALAAAKQSCSEAAIYSGIKCEIPSSLYSSLEECDDKTADFAELASVAAVNTTLAATTAALSKTAADSALEAVDDWETGSEIGTDFDSGIKNKIYQVRDDVSEAVDAARLYQSKAKSDAEEAERIAAEAEDAIKTPRDNLIKVSGKINKIFESVTASQYSQFSDLIDTLSELGYIDEEYQELRYILGLRVTINTNKEAGKFGASVYRTNDGLNFKPVTEDGFGDQYNYGLRTFLPTNKGLFMGMANPFYGAQLWKLGDKTSGGGSGGSGGGSGGSGGGGGGSTVAITEEAVPLAAITLGALNLQDHFAYVLGYEDGTVRPENSMTRAEVATIFYRLLTDESRKQYLSGKSGFRDVSSSDWFNKAVSTLVNADVLTGYSDGSFRPGAYVTRAEFATILSKFTDERSISSSLSDVSNHWAKDQINTVYAKGWVSGYSDDTFRPNKVVTRAEVMTMINRLLQRVVKSGGMLDGMAVWSDNPPDAWYYEAIQEATNSHDYERTSEPVPGQSFSYEKWTKLNENPDWSND